MSCQHGMPIWYELMTSDPDAAATFYGEVIGWTCGPFGGTVAGGDYRLFTAPDGESIAGLMKAPPQMPGSAWFSYTGVDDVDAAAAAIEKAGGSIHMPPTSLEGVGRMAMVADPGGAIFYVMKGASEGVSTAFKRMAPGHGEWNELMAADDQQALAFYGELFGWKKDGAMPMGELGEYSFISHDGGVIGAVMKARAGDRPMWNYYFRVGDIDEAKQRIERAGGTIAYGPQEVPGGDFVIYAMDPQGAGFGVVGNR